MANALHNVQAVQSAKGMEAALSLAFRVPMATVFPWIDTVSPGTRSRVRVDYHPPRWGCSLA